MSRDQVQQTQTHTKNENFQKHPKKLISHAFFKSSSSCFSRAVLAAYGLSNLYKLQAHHTIMAWLICVHALAILACHTPKKKWKLWSLLRLQRCIQVLHFFICLNQTDHAFYLLSMSITLFYLHSARKHYKNMSFTGHTVTSATHETFAKWLQPCATHSSGIVQPLVGIGTSGPQVCSSLPPKIRKPEKKHSNHFNLISHNFK